MSFFFVGTNETVRHIQVSVEKVSSGISLVDQENAYLKIRPQNTKCNQ